jgi:hypothetical protein
MAKKSQKLLVTTILLTILIISSAYTIIVPIAHAEVITDNSTAEGLTIINQVAGFDLTKYNVTSKLTVNGPTLDVLPTENVRYTLKAPGSTIELLDTFTNGSLRMMDVLENTGSPNITSSVVGMAKAFLLNYQEYSGNSFYGQLASMLNQADPLKNSTTIVGNIKFDITVISGSSPLEKSATFTWSYTANGVDAKYKCVSLGYKDGFLKVFIDTWNFYNIGSTTVNISEEQAQDIAMKSAKTYTWTVGSGNQTYIINNFNLTKPMIKYIVFCEAGNATNARSSDSLTLYPMWRIGVGLDKYYPGNVYGIYVDIWADTGQVRDMQEAFSTLPPQANAIATIAESSINNQAPNIATQSSMFPTIWIILTACTISTITAVPVYLMRKKTVSHPLRTPKLRKIGGTILCLMIGSAALMALVSAVPTASAGSALIWGNNHPVVPPDHPNPHTPPEIHNQEMISANITSWFASYGYSPSMNFQGAATNTWNIIPYTNYYSQYSTSEATVWFDHGIGLSNSISQPVLNQIQGWQNYPNEFHFMLCGSNALMEDPANDVFDYQIYGATTGNNYFSFISACMSAALAVPNGFTGTYGLNQDGSGYIVGMPYAFTHTAELSLDGYANPDTGPYCYIGFNYGSASLSQTLAGWWPTTTYYDFVYAFFYYALVAHTTVNQALDAAAYMCFTPNNFDLTTLYCGFTAHWPYCNPEDAPNCHMNIYGNGNIYLGPSNPCCVTPPSVSSNAPWPGLTNNYYQFTASSTDSYDDNQNIHYTFNWGDNSYSTAQNPSGQPVQVSHSWSSPGLYTVVVTAQNDDGVQSNPAHYYVNIVSPVYHYLTVGACSAYTACPLYPSVYVDGNYVGTAPLTISVLEGWHYVEVDYWVWNQWLSCDSYFDHLWYDDGYTGYGSGSPVPVYHNQYATAWYIP